MSELFRKIDDNFGGSMSWKTQPNCRVFDDLHPTGPWLNSWRVSRITTGCPILSWLLSRFITGCPVLSCKSYFFNMATALLSSFFLDLLLSCSETDSDGVTFPRLLTSWRKLQLSPFTHCPLDSHCQQSPRILCTRCFVPWFLTTAFFSKFPIFASKILISNFLLNTSLHHSFQSAIIRSFYLLMNLQVIQFQYSLEFFRLSYSQFVQSFQDVIR